MWCVVVFVFRQGVNLGLLVGVVMVVGMIGGNPQIQVVFQTVRVVVGASGCWVRGSSPGFVQVYESSVLHRNGACSWCDVVSRLADISLVPLGF